MPERRLVDHKDWVRMKRDQAFLQALRNGGVDNWDWYGEAYREYIKDSRGQPWAEPDDEEDDNAC